MTDSNEHMKANSAEQASSELTTSQYLIWMGQKLNAGKPLYNMAMSFKLSGNIDVEKFQEAFQVLVRRNDALRTVFLEEEDRPRQVVKNDFSYRLELIDWSDRKEAFTILESWTKERSKKIFDLSQCLFDSVLIQMPENQFVWFFNQHHLITDAWGISLQYRALADFYGKLTGEESDPFLTLPAFEDYVREQTGGRINSQQTAAVNYWKEKLNDLPALPVFYGHQRSTVATGSRRIKLDLGKERTELLRRLTKEPDLRSWTEHLTLFNIFSSLLFTYLHRVCGQQKLAIGTPSHNRSTSIQKETPGLFIELFPLAVELEEGETFTTLFEKVQEETYAFLKYAHPGASSPELSRNYNVVLNYINASFSDFNGIPMESDWVHPDHADPGHHLRLQVHDFDQTGSIQLFFDLNTSIFKGELQEQVPQHFLRLLDTYLEDRTGSIDRPALVEVEEVFEEVIQEETHPTDGLVTDLITAQVKASPEATALHFEGEAVSYQQLEEASNQLAHFLLDHGLKKGDKVVLFLKRSPEFMVSVLAVLKAGGSFVPIPTNYPSGRVLGIIEDAAARLILTTSSLEKELSLPAQKVIRLDLEQAFFSRQKKTAPQIELTTDDLAYLMYTSGSTGRPKGVMISHGALSHYLQWAQAAYIEEERPVMPLFTSIGFDLTITSIFLPLLCGGKIAVYQEQENGPNLALLRVMEDNLVNTIKLTPSHLALLSGQDLASSRIRTMIVGGEYFKASLAASVAGQFNENLKIYNEYGPTEATVGCIVHQYIAEDSRRLAVPIGAPISGTRAYLLDEFLHPVPRGVTGELYIAGPGLAEGYWQQETLTKEKFIADPFVAGEQMYRTGDLVRTNDSGQMEYLGRKDQQVKIGSRRVELEEIAAALISHEKIKEAVVTLKKRRKEQSPEDIHNCVRCGLPSNYPKAEFDEQGVCNLCRSFKSYQDKVKSYFRTIPDLRRRFEKVKERPDRAYDCIVLLSGGKDSTYVLARLVELGVRVLAFTLDNGYISEEAKDNIRRVVGALGVDHVFGETPAMNAIFVDSLKRHQNVCDGCFKTIYTLSMKLALEKNIPFIVTGLSRGQFFETRLTEELFRKEEIDSEAIDDIILEARKAYHQVDDAVKELLDVSMFDKEEVFEKVEFIDFYRYTDVSLDEMLIYLDERLSWVRPTDTGRSTNCLINKAGIYVHKKELGYSNYAFPYSWDVRVGHKTRAASLEEINEEIPEEEVMKILDEIGYSSNDDEGSAEKLVAYYTASESLSELDLKNHLLAHVPDYMVPVQYIHLDKMPLTVNGKVDQDALPMPEAIRPEMATDYIAPRTEIEVMVGEVWSEILNIQQIGVFDNFVQIGGDSLAGIRLMARINEAFELDLPINLIFEKSNIASLSSHIEDTITRLLEELDASN